MSRHHFEAKIDLRSQKIAYRVIFPLKDKCRSIRDLGVSLEGDLFDAIRQCQDFVGQRGIHCKNEKFRPMEVVCVLLYVFHPGKTIGKMRQIGPFGAVGVARENGSDCHHCRLLLLFGFHDHASASLDLQPAERSRAS